MVCSPSRRCWGCLSEGLELPTRLDPFLFVFVYLLSYALTSVCSNVRNI